MSHGRCSKCGQDITWARTLAGKAMPLDPGRYDTADTTANLAVFRDHTGRINARALTADETPDRHEWRGMPHFATCPALVTERDAKAGRIENVIPLRRRRQA